MFKIKSTKDGYILYRPAKGYEWHSHFKTYHKARTCLAFIERGVMPGNGYLRESCRRLLTDEEFRRLDKGQPYKNRQRGRQAYYSGRR